MIYFLFYYHKIATDILLNQNGIIREKLYTIASPERAVCDSLYLDKRISFDNLGGLDANKLRELSLIYKNKRLVCDVNNLIKELRNQ